MSVGSSSRKRKREIPWAEVINQLNWITVDKEELIANLVLHTGDAELVLIIILYRKI